MELHRIKGAAKRCGMLDKISADRWMMEKNFNDGVEPGSESVLHPLVPNL